MANLDLQPRTAAFILAVLVFAVAAWRAFVALRRHARAPYGKVDWPLELFAVVTGTIVATGWFATILASLGRFSVVASAGLLFLGAILCLAATFAARRPNRAAAPLSRPGLHEAGLGLVLIVAALLYFHPHEYVLGGTDAGTYFNTAVSTASTGELLQHDDWTGLLTRYGDTALRTQPEPLLTRHLQFVGWYIDDVDPTLSRPQFFPFHPVFLALAVALAGPMAALLVTPLWGVLGVAALYFLARALFDKHVALLAALFLALTPTQIFFARYPTTEPLTLLLLFVALLAFQIVWEDEQRSLYWGLLGGAALGAALLTRIDLPVILAFFVLGIAVRAWQGRWSPAWTAFAVTLGAFVVQMVLSIVFINWPYFWNTYLGVYLAVRQGGWLFIAAAIVALFLVLIALRAGPVRVGDFVARLENSAVLRWVLAGMTIGLSAYAYFLRPTLEPVTFTTSWPANVEFPVLNDQNWLRMGWYLTPFGLTLATAGLALIFLRSSLSRLAIVLGVTLFTTVQYVYNVLNTPYHIYTMRRYVPVVIPMLLLFAAIAIMAIPQVRRHWITYALRFTAVALLAGGLLYQSRFVLPQRDMAGSLAQLDELEGLLASDAVIIIAEPSTSVFADTFGVPLQFLYDHRIATVRSASGDVATYLQDVLDWAAEHGRPVQLLAEDSLPPNVRDTLLLEPRARYSFAVDMLMNTFDSYPEVIQRIRHAVQIYDVSGARSAGDMRPPDTRESGEPSSVDIGGLDALSIGSGFYSAEELPGGPTMRWTAGQAFLDIPLPTQWARAGGLGTLEVRAMTYRPESSPPRPVTVYVDGQVVGQFTPTAQWKTYTFPVVAPPDAQDRTAVVEFDTEAFVPAQLGLNADTRSLGFLLDWVKLVSTKE